MQTHASTELHILISSIFLHIFLYCIPAELEIYSVTHYDMGLKKNPAMDHVVLMLKCCLRFSHPEKTGSTVPTGCFSLCTYICHFCAWL